LGTNPANAFQTGTDGAFRITRLNVTGGNYENVSNSSTAVSLSGVDVSNMTGVTMNAQGTAAALSISGCTQVRVPSGYAASTGTVNVQTSGTCTNCFLGPDFNWGQSNGASGSLMSNAGVGCNVETRLTSVPTQGTWRAGDRARILGVTVGNPKAYTRLTSSSANVVPTDWVSEGNL